MKILITTDWYEPVVNGVVTSVRTLMEELEKRGYEVRVLTLSRDRCSYIRGNVYYAGSADAGRIYPEARFRLPVSGRCVRELADWGPDIIHSQCEFSTFLLAKRIAGERNIPVIHTYHTIYEDYTHYFSPKKTWGRNVVRLMTRRLSRQVSGMIVPSEKIRRILESYQVECPLWVVPSGIRLSRFSRCGAAPSGESWRDIIRKQYGISRDEMVLLYVGRLEKEKNIEELLEYQKETVQRRGPGPVLMIVGGGPYRKILENRVKELNTEERVIFTGMIPPEEVGKYYQAGDLFVSASASETQGMTYGEALAAGKPLLCRKDGCLEGVVREGKNGWQYENLEQFLAFLEEWTGLDEDGRRNMCKSAEESAVRFSAETFGREVERIYEQERKRAENLEYYFAGRPDSVCRTGSMGV